MRFPEMKFQVNILTDNSINTVYLMIKLVFRRFGRRNCDGDDDQQDVACRRSHVQLQSSSPAAFELWNKVEKKIALPRWLG